MEYRTQNQNNVHYETKAYSVLSGCRLKINNLIPNPISLNYQENSIPEFKYNFALELETIAEVEEERKDKQKQQQEEEIKQRERDLKAQEEAWSALQIKRHNTLPPPKPTNQDTLIDLDFDEPEEIIPSPMVEETPKKTPVTPKESYSFLSPKYREVALRLSEMGLSAEAIQTGLEIVGEVDEMKLINFVADFSKLEEQTKSTSTSTY